MNLFLIFLLFMVVIPYIGGVILAFFSRHYKNHYQVSESYVIGFSIGQLLLLKAFTILGYLQLIDFDNTILVLVVFLLLTIFLDWSDDWYIARRCLKKAVDCRYLKFKQPVWLVSIFIFILLLSMLVDVTPPRHADMLRYHLEYSNYIFNSKSLPFVPHYVLALSTDAELLFSMIIMWFGSSYVKLVVYVNFLFCIYAASIYFESSKDRVKKYAIGFFVASPILFLASTIVKPDTIQLLYFIVSLLLINKLFQKFSFTSLILIAIFLGEIVSLKWTGVIPVLSLTIYLIFLFLIKAENRKTLLYLIVAIGIATIIIPMYWYVRNYLATGNPIWPILNHLFVVNDHSLLYEVTTHGSSRSGEIAEYGFLGYLFYTFFIYKPSLLGGLGVSYYLSLPLAIYKSTDKKIIYNFVFVIIYIIVWYFAQASFRHLIWLLPFIAVIASYGYIRSKTWRYGILKYANKVVILLVIFQLVFIAIYSTFFIKYSIGVVSDDEYYATTPNYHAFKEVEIDINNPVKKVLVIVPGSEIYYLNQPHIDGNSGFSAIIDYKKINSITALLNKLDELEVDFILFDDELIQSEIYIDLRSIITQSPIVGRYDSKIIKNRLLGKSIMKHLTLVKRIHD